MTKLQLTREEIQSAIDGIEEAIARHGITDRGISISTALMGHSVSEETRRKISVALKGRKHSEETRLKMSEAQKNRKRTSKETSTRG